MEPALITTASTLPESTTDGFVLNVILITSSEISTLCFLHPVTIPINPPALTEAVARAYRTLIKPL